MMKLTADNHQRTAGGICCLIFALIAFNAIESRAQKALCFRVDMREPIECGLFSPLDSDQVIIRGSFNDWSGNDYCLTDIDQDDIYENSFRIDADSDSIHEFKYLIIKSNGQELWEKRPNPNNMPYGNRSIDSTLNRIDDFDFDKYFLGAIGKDVVFSEKEIKNDFIQFRRTLEDQHCCLYEYTSKPKLDSLFDSQFRLLTRPLSAVEFYRVLTPITAKIGCGHTAVWMAGGYWDLGKNKLFPLTIRLIAGEVVVAGSYADSVVMERGSILQEIDGVPVSRILAEMRANYSADAMNRHFIDSQIERRFPLIYARRFGFKDKFQVTYTLPNKESSEIMELSPASISAVRAVVFSNFNHPPLHMKMIDSETVLLKIPTFIYYDRVPFFTNFIDSCFAVIRQKSLKQLILDLRGNDGGDPFCAAPLFSYLQKSPTRYFAEPYGKYAELARPLPLPENHYRGELFTLIDGRCFSTNGHFCSLLKYHKIGQFVGTESGATYKCNSGKNTEIHLQNTRIILTFGRSTFAAAVEGMDKTKPIVPDIPVRETVQDFLADKDLFIETALQQIARKNKFGGNR
ncbi:hypothetical protein JW992_09635 [candidate division KSB1 bacterium]|nr:hypothetical protein [candidate division KSB1 bacterium]